MTDEVKRFNYEVGIGVALIVIGVVSDLFMSTSGLLTLGMITMVMGFIVLFIKGVRATKSKAEELKDRTNGGSEIGV